MVCYVILYFTYVVDVIFALPITEGFSKKLIYTILYPNLPSAIIPVPHGDGLPIPELPINITIFEIRDMSSSDENELKPIL